MGGRWLKLSPLPPVAADTFDEVAQYLDHLLQRTVPQANLPPTAQRGGLSRFRAAVHTTRDLMSLASKAKDLHVQSESGRRPPRLRSVPVVGLRRLWERPHPCGIRHDPGDALQGRLVEQKVGWELAWGTVVVVGGEKCLHQPCLPFRCGDVRPQQDLPGIPAVGQVAELAPPA